MYIVIMEKTMVSLSLRLSLSSVEIYRRGDKALSQSRSRPQSGQQLVSLSPPRSYQIIVIGRDDNIVIRLIAKSSEITIVNETAGFARLYDRDTLLETLTFFRFEVGGQNDGLKLNDVDYS